MSVTISGTGSITGAKLNKKIETFTASGTWTVPAGVTYAIAHVRGGGGGIGATSAAGGSGGTSSVAFSSGTISGPGLPPAYLGYASFPTESVAGSANSGASATGARSNAYSGMSSASSTYNVGGGTVTPGESVTVTVGAGGTAGASGTTAAGGSGYVYIEYYAD